MRISAHGLRLVAQACSEIVAVAVLWTLLYKLNSWFFASFAVSSYVSWIFLPAAVRVLAVMVADWRGICGLFAGAIVTSLPTAEVGLQYVVFVALLSGLSPYIALLAGRKYFKLNNLLDSITPKQVIIISALSALCSALLHSSFYALADESVKFLHTFLQMFVGDLLGTAMVLTGASAALKPKPSLNTTKD